MCSGPILGKLLLFSLPLMASNLLQHFFHVADIIVVGNFAGSLALAAVGATSTLINLLIAVCLGLSVGSSVTMAASYGAGRIRELNEGLHTSILLSLILGVLMTGVGAAFSRPLLVMMNTPGDVLDQAVLYMRIYFSGMPAILLYNFGSAALRATGDTRRPLLYLTVSGLLNVLLNLFFVIVLGMAAAGVACATVLSQCVSAVLVTVCLMRSDGSMRLRLRALRIHADQLKAFVRVGLPAGLQSIVFNISNVFIQSAVNSFGSMAVAGNSAATSLEAFMATAFNAVSVGGMTFAGQNVGARRYDRLARVAVTCTLLIGVFSLAGGNLINAFSGTLLRIFTQDEQAIAFGQIRTGIMLTFYLSCTLMDLYSNLQRGMGYSLTPMIVSTIGVVGFRMAWLLLVFPADPTPRMLYMAYPISWTVTMLIHVAMFVYRRRKLVREYGAAETGTA